MRLREKSILMAISSVFTKQSTPTESQSTKDLRKVAQRSVETFKIARILDRVYTIVSSIYFATLSPGVTAQSGVKNWA